MEIEDQTQRLDKFLSHNGIASRRGVKDLLKYNDVTVNGKKVRESGTRILASDIIKVNGKVIKTTNHVYYILNKPIGIISTSSDEYGRENVTDLIDSNVRIYPVGRLDKDTHGLILLTNDGELTHKLTHPKYHVSKIYVLKIKGLISEEKLNKLRNGIILSDGITAPANVKTIKVTEGLTTLEMEIFEGRYRQIRRMCEKVWAELLDLKRVEFGPVKIGNLKEGQYRPLTKNEIESLREAVNK